MEVQKKICIIGAGPAGLAAAYELVKHGVTDLVVVDRNAVVGGLSRTEMMPDKRAGFDIGPHRFFTKNNEVKSLWFKLIGEDFLTVNRITRIYYNGKLFAYPIRAGDVLMKLGPVESFLCFVSYLKEHLVPKREIRSFEDWVTSRFGARLYTTFFKYYTEKVWGIPCREIEAQWAAQRIKGLDFREIVKKMLGLSSRAKSLVETFHYPRCGAGQMYEKMAEVIRKAGGDILLNTEVVSYHMEGDRVASVEVKNANGELSTLTASHYFNSAPLTVFFDRLKGADIPDVMEANRQLYYRGHITVNILAEGENLFPDQWIYIHDPSYKMARIANYNNFAKEMVNRKGLTALSAEYFSFPDEAVWQMTDEALIQLAIDEIRGLGLAGQGSLEGVSVIREAESYPAYYLGYEKPFRVLREKLDAIVNLSPVGRGGLFKYNNQDHSIYSGLVAARNYLFEDHRKSVWSINIDAEYQEE